MTAGTKTRDGCMRRSVGERPVDRKPGEPRLTACPGTPRTGHHCRPDQTRSAAPNPWPVTQTASLRIGIGSANGELPREYVPRMRLPIATRCHKVVRVEVFAQAIVKGFRVSLK